MNGANETFVTNDAAGQNENVWDDADNQRPFIFDVDGDSNQKRKDDNEWDQDHQQYEGGTGDGSQIKKGPVPPLVLQQDGTASSGSSDQESESGSS